MRSHPFPTPLLLCALGALTAVSSCGKLRYGGTQSQDDVINALRAENHILKDQLATRDKQVAELEAKVAGPLSADALAALPAVASLEIDRLSSIEPTRTDPSRSMVVVYLRTLDGGGHFIQATGTVQVGISQEGGPILVLSTVTHTFSPKDLRAAFRTGFTGTFYVLRIPFDRPIDRDLGLILDVTLLDAVTGKTHTARRRIGDAPERPIPAGKQGV